MTSARLGEVTKTMQGGKLKLSGKHFVERGYPAFGAGGVNGLVETAEFKGTAIVLSAIGARCGKCFLAEGEWTSLANTRLIFPDQDRVDVRFLWYQLNDENRWPRSGAAQPFIRPADVNSHEIYLPPLEEQKLIVAVLDQAFAALDRARFLAETNLADAEELFERQLAREFAGAVDPKERVPFGQLCTTLTPKTKIQRKEYLEEGAFPIVSQEADLVSGYWNDQSALMGLSNPVVVFGDHTRCLKYIDFDFVVGADGTKVLQPKSGIDPLYLYYGLRSVPLAEKGYARHFKFLKEVSLPKRELSEQGRVSLGLRSLEEEVSKLTASYYDKLGELTDLRQSFLQKAFAGELT